MAAGRHHEELQLIARVMAGDAAAQARFLSRADDVIWTAVVALAGDGQAGEDAHADVMTALAADGFARLARYKGLSQLSVFLTLVTKEVLGERVARNISLSPDRAWLLFERLFNKDIENLIRKRFPRDGKAEREDIRQNLDLRLIENDYRRVRAYKGKDSFPGFIMVVVNNLLLDMLRQKIGRRRLPAKITRLPEWQQRVFELAAWEGVGMDLDRIAEALEGKIEPSPSRAEIASVMEQLALEIAEARDADAAGGEISVDTPGGQTVIEGIVTSSNPENDLIQKEEEEQNRQRDEHINRKAEKLPPKERLYRSLTKDSVEPMPPRIIARTMAISVDEANLLKQRMDRWLKKVVQDHANTATGPSDKGRSAI